MKKIPVKKSVFASITAAFLLTLFTLLPACQTEPTPESGEKPEDETTSATVPASDISVSELKDKLENGHQLLIVDIRSEDRYSGSHIEGAVSIPLNDIPDCYHEIPRDIEVVVYSGCA